jgi:hypothetical protein
VRVVEDDIGLVVAEMRAMSGTDTPYYLPGYREEIASKLLARNNDKRFTFQRYPVIALNTEFGERKLNGVVPLHLNIGIIMFTDRNYDTIQRLENIFKPILLPLYEKFFEALSNSPFFSWSGDLEMPDHTMIKRYYWSSTEGRKFENIFNDPIDAIEIRNLSINHHNHEACVHVPRPEVKVFDETFDLTFV